MDESSTQKRSIRPFFAFVAIAVCMVYTSACRPIRWGRQQTHWDEKLGVSSGESENGNNRVRSNQVDLTRTIDKFDGGTNPLTDCESEPLNWDVINELLLELESESISTYDEIETP
jgi:hypothetical protein